jgi:hypothetical protein
LVFFFKYLLDVLEELGVGQREVLEKTRKPVVEKAVEDLETEELILTENTDKGKDQSWD